MQYIDYFAALCIEGHVTPKKITHQRRQSIGLTMYKTEKTIAVVKPNGQNCH